MKVISKVSVIIRNKKGKIARLLYLVPKVTRNMKGKLKNCASYIVYGQIWLNLPREDC